MKILALLALFTAVGCVMATGCVAQIKKDPGNVTVSPTGTFAPFTNDSTLTLANMTNTTNATNLSNATPKLKGPLRVSISGYPLELNVTLDNVTVGKVKPTIPLDMMVDEGNHTVSVCVGWVCENETVVTAFGKQKTVDFGDRLRKDVEFPSPTARLLEYFKNGDGVSVNIEYINPDIKDHVITVEVGLGYSYIDYRSGQRVGESARSKESALIAAGTRETHRVDLTFADGYSHMYDVPAIRDITIR